MVEEIIDLHHLEGLLNLFTLLASVIVDTHYSMLRMNSNVRHILYTIELFLSVGLIVDTYYSLSILDIDLRYLLSWL